MKNKPVLSRITLLSFILIIPFLVGSSNQLVQNDDERFYLSNYTSFSPGSNVTINLYSNAYKKGFYNFRLLKINDPLKFFSSANQSVVRGNFDIWGNEKESLLKYSSIVKEWRDRVELPSKHGYRNNVHVGRIDEPGIYIIQAERENQVAYCGVVVSDLALVYKNSGKQILTFAADSHTSEFLKNVKFNLYSGNELIDSKFSDNEGLAVFNIDDPTKFGNNQPLLIAQTGDETIVSDAYFYFGNNDRNYLAYVYTNQPVYRPGQEVFFKSVFREKKGNEILNLKNEEFSVSIKSPRNKEVFSQSLNTNEFGSLSGSFILDEEADLGYYNIQLTKDNRNYYGSFSVEEYKKPEYFVTVKTEKDQYAGKDLIKGTVTADYYFGSPVLNGKVEISIYKNIYWRPWWYWSDYAWFYRSYSQKMIIRSDKQLVKQISGELNSEGKYEFEYQAENETEADYIYSVSASVTDYSRRSISGYKDVFVTRGSFTISTSPEKYFYERGNEIRLRVNASDFSDKPVQTKFKVVIGYPDPNNKNRWRSHSVYDSLYGSTDASGRAVVSFNPSSYYPGYYSYNVITSDEKGREISANSSFFIGNKNDYWTYRDNSGLEIVTDKDSYEKGDSLIAYIFMPSENTEMLLTYETDSFLDYRKINVKEKSFTIREKLTDKFSPGFNISITFVKDRQFYTTTKLVGVLAKDKFLDISVKRNKVEYKPGDDAEYNILVKDFKGNPVKNSELSFGIVDESIYAIREDVTPNIQTFFYAPSYSYIPVYSSLQRHSFNGSSRKITYADKNFNGGSLKGSESLQGKILLKGSNNPASFIYVFLSSDKGYYKTSSDSLGNYIIKSIAKGSYDVFVSSAGGTLAFIEKIYIEGEEKFDIKIDETIDALDLIPVGRAESFMALEVNDASAPQISAVAVSGFSKEKSSYVEAELRSNFVDASIWKAHLVTDQNGEATIKFKMPDNLTTWRATIKGITEATDVGEQLDKVIARKNLLVRMETPRFFREGDELNISTIIHNYLNEKKKTKISFNGQNIKMVESKINTPGYKPVLNSPNKNGVYEVTIEKNSELRIDWTIRVDNPVGEAVLTAEALTNEESDAIQLKVPILPKGFREVKTFAADLTSDISNQDEEIIEFKIPSDVDLRTANLSISASPSLAGTILKALDDLVAYPYGCVEQTMSRFLPAVIAANTFREIDAPVKASTIQMLPDVVDAGLKRLYNFQHADGGWGWWENDPTNAYMTAYVIYGMSLAKDAGYKINEGIYQTGINNLKELIKQRKENDITTLSYILYSLSVASRIENLSYQYKNDLQKLLSENLNSYSLSLLTIAAKNFNDQSLVNEFSSKLIKQAEEEKDFAFWAGKEFHYRWQDDKVQSTAFAVKALIQTGSNSELVNKAIKWLLVQKQGFSWRSTQETAVVIFALTDYLKITQELNPDFDIEVYVNNEKIIDKKFTRKDIFNEAETIHLKGIDSKILNKGNNKIRIVKNGTGKLYFSGLNEYYTQNQTAAAKVNRFKISREYFTLRTERRADRLIYVKDKFTGAIKSGENIFVKTRVETEGDNLQYFILEDMLPSGFEVVKDEQEYLIEEENDYREFYPGYRPWRWFYADKEYRDEKVAFFVTNVNSVMEFSYIIKAQIPGKYSSMPAQGYLMYFPEVSGGSGIIDIEVLE